MSNVTNISGTNVAAPIAPFTSADNYPTHYAQYGKGGFRTVDTYGDLNKIPEPRLEEGMLVYVIEDKHAYQWIEGNWVKSKVGGGIEKVESLSDVPSDYNEEGNIIYAENPGAYYYYDGEDWVLWGEQQIYVGPTEPIDTRALWIDTANHRFPENYEILYSINNAIKELQRQVSLLMNIRTSGVIAGDIDDGERTELINAAEPEKPRIKIETEAESFDIEAFKIDVEAVYTSTDIVNLYIPAQSKLIVLLWNNNIESAQELLDIIKEYTQRFQENLDSIVPGFCQLVASSQITDGEEVLESAIHQAELCTSDAWDNDVVESEPPKDIEPTVKHISIKMGTLEQLNGNLKNYVPGELLWCTSNGKLYIYNNGALRAISGSSNDNIDDIDDMTELEIRNAIAESLQSVESIGFIPVGSESTEYVARVNSEGKFIVYKKNLDDYPISEPKYYDSKGSNNVGVQINSFYLGGDDNDCHSYQPCSHNFIELSNARCDKNGNFLDINLNGYYLLYSNDLENWEVLPLWGTIPGGGTFLIRGDQCSVMDVNTTKIKVKTYDMEWYTKENKLIRFSQTRPMPDGSTAQIPAIFYLCWTDCYLIDGVYDGTKTFKIHCLNNTTGEDELVESPSASSGRVLFRVTKDSKGNEIMTVPTGFIDLVGYGDNDGLKGFCEKSSYPLVSGNKIDVKNVIFKKWYQLDPVSQSNPKGLSKRNNKKYFTATCLSGGNFDDRMDIEELCPKASFENKTIATSRTKFAEDYPSTLTCSFGIQASDNSENSGNSMPPAGNGATRCFCWNSVGYYDEYLEYRKVGTSEWIQLDSISDNTSYIQVPQSGVDLYSDIRNTFLEYYKRVRWETAYGQAITTHRVILRGLKAGTYEYKVTRKDDPNYGSSIGTRQFTIKKDSQITSFNFVQTTDQQGANWEEYEVWNLSAKVIKKENDRWINGYQYTDSDTGQSVTVPPHTDGVPDYDFIINTGDICYNGSRSNEWIDYFIGYEPLSNKEEMLTVGNNDLAPISMRDIGDGSESPWKINVYVIDYFYTFEIDPRNPQVFTGKKTIDESGTKISSTYKMPSLYSFNYGKFHFISLLSEIRTRSNSTSYSTEGAATESNMAQTTVNTMFGIDDTLRSSSALHSASIFDVEEGWIIKDLILWKNRGTFPDRGSADYWTRLDDSDVWANRDAERYCSELKGKCRNCIIFTHEMPFNIISTSSYKEYYSVDTVANMRIPRETAKAYLNRFHNYEYQRLFKIWGIPMVMGGHKHTAAITYPVYDAPIGYNPITSRDVDLMTDPTGTFSPGASFMPFVQVKASELGDFLTNFGSYFNEVYNNTSSSISVGGTTINSGSYKLDLNSDNKHPKLRLEVVNNITAPSYIMCQATGFKNKSNSDLAATKATSFPDTEPALLNPNPKIPWERFYISEDEVEDTQNGQCFPFFTVFEIDDTKIVSKMYKITGMYTASSKAGYWDLTKIYGKKGANTQTLEQTRAKILAGCEISMFNGAGTTIIL